MSQCYTDHVRSNQDIMEERREMLILKVVLRFNGMNGLFNRTYAPWQRSVVGILRRVTTPRDPIQPVYYRDHHTLADLLFADALEY